jgi:hypothetical protein
LCMKYFIYRNRQNHNFTFGFILKYTRKHLDVLERRLTGNNKYHILPSSLLCITKN